MVSSLTFKSLIYFEFIFVYGMRKWSNLILLHVAIQFSHTTYWREYLFCIVYSHLLCCILIDHMSMGLFLGSILFHWSMCPFLCQFHTVLITIALYYILKSGSVIPLAFFFFLMISLSIWGLLWFHTNFRIICSSSAENVMGLLIATALNL